MSKKIIVFILIVFSAVLIIYFVSSSKGVNLKVDDTAKVKREGPKIEEQIKKDIVDPEKLESEYISQTKMIISRFDKLSTDINADEPNTEPEIIKNLINDLGKLIVPADHKDMHLNLVLAFSRIESYLKDGNEDDRAAGFSLIKESKEKNPWLNN